MQMHYPDEGIKNMLTYPEKVVSDPEFKGRI